MQNKISSSKALKSIPGVDKWIPSSIDKKELKIEGKSVITLNMDSKMSAPVIKTPILNLIV